MRFTARAATSPAVDVQPGGGLAGYCGDALIMTARPDVPDLSATMALGLQMSAQPLLLRPVNIGARFRGTMAVQARNPMSLTMTATATNAAAPDFDYYRDFVLAGQADLAAETLTGFVIQGWTLSGAWLKTTANGGRIQSDDGWDIRFEDQFGVQLAHALSDYDGVAGTATVDVRIPSWVVRSDYRFKIKYGSAGLVASQADPAGCWQRAAAVWTWPGGGDITGRGRVLTPSSVTAGSESGSGAFGTGSYARAIGPTWANGLTAVAVEAMITPTSAANGASVFRIGGTAADSTDFALYTFTSGQKYSVFTRFGGGVSYSALGPTDSIKAQRQHVVAGGNSGAVPKLYVDGAVQATTAGTGSTVGTGSLAVAAAENASVGKGTGEQTSAVPGTYGRVIVWPFLPSAAWVAASYRIQSNAAAMIGMGAENAAGATNRSPVAVPMVGTAVENAETTFDVALRSWDPEGGTLTPYVPSAPTQGSSRIVSGRIGYTPQGGTAGQTHTVPFGVRDPASQSSASVIRVAVTQSVPATRFRSGMPWMSGAIFANNPDNVRAFETWLTRPVDITITYTGTAFSGTSDVHEATADLQWAKIRNSTNQKANGFIKRFMDMGIAVCHVQPILVYQETGNWPAIARGDRDADHQAVASAFASWLLPAREANPNYPMLYLCMGQEVNQDSMAWRYTRNIGSPAQYVAAHRRICTIYKDTLGAAVKFTWNTLNQSGDISQVFPGARGDVPGGVIDVLTSDNYDNGYDNSYFTNTKAAGFASWLNNGGSGYTRNVQYRCPRNALRWAADHGLKWGIQEWGPSRYRNLADPLKPDGTPNPIYIDPADRNPDNKYYVEGMRDFFYEVRGSLEFEILFNQIDNVHKLYPEKPWLTQPSRAYRSQFRPNPTARPGGDNPYP